MEDINPLSQAPIDYEIMNEGTCFKDLIDKLLNIVPSAVCEGLVLYSDICNIACNYELSNHPRYLPIRCIYR